MKFDTIQTSFAGGEFGPSLYGRTDISQYANACQLIENFLVRPYGSAISTPGTRYVATASNSTLRSRLIKFIFNQTDAYVIEMGDQYMRFFTNRGQIVAPGGTEDFSAFGANLIAQYKFNDNAATTVVLDGTTSHNATSTVITSTLHATGKVGTGCFDFDGQYYVTVPDSNAFTFSDLTTGTNPFSIVAWVYCTATGAYQDIVTKWDTGQEEYLTLIKSDGTLAFYIYDKTNAAVSIISTNSAPTQGWHLITFTYNGVGGASASAGQNIYIDTAIVTDVTRTTDAAYAGMRNGTSPLFIGTLFTGGLPIRYFSDKMDNVCILNIAITATQIATLFTSTIYQISNVYLEYEIAAIQYCQLNDIIWIAHPSHPPQQLIRTAAAQWSIGDFAFKGGPFLDDNTTTTTITPSATSGTINITVSPTNASLFTLSTGTLGHKNSYWKIGGFSQTNSTTGLQEEGYVQITNVVNSYTATATVIKNLKDTSATTRWAEGAWSSVRGYPARVTFHERRLWFARTDHEPQKIWGSKTFEYNNYALDTQVDDDALNLALASNESNEIQWTFSGKSLIAGTYGGAFVVNSGSSSPITPDNANATNEISFGANSIGPKKIGNFIYYVQRFGKKLRELFFDFYNDSHKAVDRTILSPHILGDGVIDMDFQQNPDPVLHCVLTSGTIATLTREADQEFAAWSRQSTNGTYTSIAIIPSQASDYDEAWVLVTRWINGSQKKYIEYFENITVPDRQDQCLYLHSALTYDAYQSTSTSNATISLSASVGSITLTCSSSYFAAGNVGKRIRAIDANGTVLGEGQITAFGSVTSVTFSITTTFSALSYMAGYWGVSASSVAGVNHLEAKTVGILADGVTESLTRTIASGAVTLGSNYFVISVGLSYDQIIYTLPKEAGARQGTAQGKPQRIDELAFKLNRSFCGFKYGADANNLDMLTSVDSTLTQSLTTGVIGNIPFRGGYPRGAQVYIKNSNPLPVEIVSMITALDTEE